MSPAAGALLALLKKFVMDEVILRPELQALQYRGQKMILKVFEIYLHNSDRLLPPEVLEESQQSEIRTAHCATISRALPIPRPHASTTA